MATRIRHAEGGDAEALNRIYNHYIVETPITFDLEPATLAARVDWLSGFSTGGRHQCLVADVDGVAVGWACSKQFRTKAAYDTSVETSIYLDASATGSGLGSRLYQALFEALDGQDLRRALGGVTLPNAASVALHRRFGFESVGVFSEVGRKFDRYWDVQWFEKPLSH